MYIVRCSANSQYSFLYSAKITDSTKDALNALVEKQISAAMPVQAAEKLAPAQYIRFETLP